MKLIRNMSVKAKLLAGFLLCLIFLAIASGLGILGMRTLNNNAKEIYNYNLQSIDYLHQIKENLLNNRTEIDSAVLYKNPDMTKESIKAIENYTEEDTLILERFIQLGHSEEVKASYDKIMVLLEEYREVRSGVLDLAGTGKYDAAKVNMYKITEVRVQIDTELDSLIEWSQNEANNKNIKLKYI